MAQVLNQNSTGSYTFSSQPRAVQQRKKYKEQFKIQPDDQLNQYGNIMYDRRVIRGNTYAVNTLPAAAQPDPVEIQRQQEERKRALARRRAREQAKRHTPEPVEGRKHIPIQTELYLEELSDRVEEVDVDVQTDAFLDRPPSPLFIPAKTGVDQSTQILEGELFDFDKEVKPILEVLVGKTIEQSLLEVMEEEELAALRKQQREYEELRNAEKVEQQRLEEQERRLREEKHRRMKQAADILRLEKETAEKLAAKAFAKSYLADLVPSVFNNLRENGYFYDPVQRDLETGFMPWIIDSTMNELDTMMLGRLLLDNLIKEVVQNRSQEYEELMEQLKELILSQKEIDQSFSQQPDNLDSTLIQAEQLDEQTQEASMNDDILNDNNEDLE
ncbi:unnamed protein product [Brachionus calyciflorus]|uniref:Radial spoke 3 n=1 Tax=Brachionus calyciflorus TaxID=104777 RepID=A0A813ZYT6_9BILA|nr:unnamed protein product [Brachionus calyciflorus]